MSNIYQNRLSELMHTLGNFEAALITSEINIQYFTGFPSSEGALFITPSYSALLVDFRYYEAASSMVTNCHVELCGDRIQKIVKLVNYHSVKNLYLESDVVTVRTFNAYRNALEHVSLDASAELTERIGKLRIIKDDYELEQLRSAQKIAEKSYIEVLNFLKPGTQERRLALELEYLMRKNGAERVAFDLITIAGENTSRPHGVPGEYKIKSGDFVTFDIGAVYNGYHSDMTRTVALSFADDEKRRVYETVRKAQSAALSTIKEGVCAADADFAARSVIANAGYGEYFGHAAGHGVGLEIHELPVLSPKSGVILKKNMIVTVEPGIYLPGKFGVRIEDTVRVLENGIENLANIRKDLIIL